MRILLLNPPGRDVYIRDYYCSKTTKSNYLYQPIDLLVLSGRLGVEHEVDVLDAMAEGLTADEARRRVLSIAPDVVIALVGAVSWDEDREFLRALSASTRVIVTGDVVQEASVPLLREEPWIEAALHDFAHADVLDYLAGRREDLHQLTVRDAEGAPLPPNRARAKGAFTIPRPRHELFQDGDYRFSFARERRFATVLTDYGCPYPCTFCVIGTLGFAVRPVDEVLEEIDALRAAGTREVFFLDQTFGVHEERAHELCDAFARRGDISWTAFTRPDKASDELLAAMRRAGCHTLILGVESADDASLRQYRKGYDVEAVRGAIARARRHGLRTVGTFIIGLPEDTEATLDRTVDFAIELGLDFMSLNVAVPRFGTPFRERLVDEGLTDPTARIMDQGGGRPSAGTPRLQGSELARIHRRMIRRFYLRPGYLWRRLRGVRSLGELVRQGREGWALVARSLVRPRASANS